MEIYVIDLVILVNFICYFLVFYKNKISTRLDSKPHTVYTTENEKCMSIID